MATDANVFEITQAAALMCQHLPIRDGCDFLAFLDRWQTFIGSFVGGVLGVVAAFIVAFKQMHREWVMAASSVLRELMSLQATNDGILKYASRYLITLPQRARKGAAGRPDTCLFSKKLCFSCAVQAKMPFARNRRPTRFREVLHPPPP